MNLKVEFNLIYLFFFSNGYLLTVFLFGNTFEH
jgi:hypothetical protein